ncbi:MAG TPA: hypothetical protein VK807_21340 [Gemmatimonadaceae bacterium]|jgi:Tol biopolymer transport system component|nr:hypothetical protein [Gemmatimonadaceae bacterium]
MRLVVVGISILAAHLADSQAAPIPFVPHTFRSAATSAMSYRPVESAIGWVDSGRTLVFSHLAIYEASQEEWAIRCEESGIFALDVDRRTIKKLYGLHQFRTIRRHLCPFEPHDGSLTLGRANELLYGYEGGQHNVHVLDLTNMRETGIGPPCDYTALSLRLSPDQQTIALVSQCVHRRVSTPLAIMRADGSHLHVLAPKDTGGAHEPSWSPDGRQLVYTRTDGTAADVNGHVAIIDTSGVLLRIFGPGSSPDWSPTGEWIAYLSPGAVAWFEAAVHIVRPDGTGDRVVFAGQQNDPHPAKSHPYNEGSPLGPIRWSPDGHTIALGRVDSAGTMLWRLDVHSGTMTQLTSVDGRSNK